jgi:tubby-related protein 1
MPGVGLKNPLRAHLTSGVETPEGTFLVKTREPVFDAYTNSYRLNFSGRVTVPSIKNLQIIHDDYPNETLCQFGKTDKNRFHLDFRRPFNAFQAFCIALASFSHH